MWRLKFPYYKKQDRREKFSNEGKRDEFWAQSNRVHFSPTKEYRYPLVIVWSYNFHTGYEWSWRFRFFFIQLRPCITWWHAQLLFNQLVSCKCYPTTNCTRSQRFHLPNKCLPTRVPILHFKDHSHKYSGQQISFLKPILEAAFRFLDSVSSAMRSTGPAASCVRSTSSLSCGGGWARLSWQVLQLGEGPRVEHQQLESTNNPSTPLTVFKEI